jgi:tetratricopeptide (TPR) repeat protein
MKNLLLVIFILSSALVNAQSKKQKQEYARLIVSADSAFNLKNYPFAKEKYVKASLIKPKEQYPASRISECDKLSFSQNAEYKRIIHIADSCYAKENWGEAKIQYMNALKVKPYDQYANDQTKNCNFAIVAAAALESRYKETLKSADSCFKIKSWSCAKAKYEAANKMKPQEQYPVQKIKECESKIIVGVDKERYSISVSEADRQYDAGNYIAAKRNYEEALSFNPGDRYAIQRIELCNQKTAEQQK